MRIHINSSKPDKKETEAMKYKNLFHPMSPAVLLLLAAVLGIGFATFDAASALTLDAAGGPPAPPCWGCGR